MKKRHLLLFCLIVLILSVFGCSEKSSLPDELKYDPAILKEFEQKEWVPVIVRLEDRSGIDLNDPNEKRYILSAKIGEWYQPVIDEFTSTLPKESIIVTSKVFNGFRANITKIGLDMLRDNQDVFWVEWDQSR